MRSIREEQQYEIARKMPSEVLAAAAIDQAKNFVLSEAMALDIAAEFGHAAEIARKLRVKYARMNERCQSSGSDIHGTTE
jgi:hypothetical protein